MGPPAFLFIFLVFIFICVQGFTLNAQNSTDIRAEPRVRRSLSEYMEKNGGTAMDTIISVNHVKALKMVEGVRVREGDIAVSRQTERSCFARSCLWSKSVDGHVYIPYTLSRVYSDTEQRNIKQGMEMIEKGTCIQFVPRTHQRDFLDIQPKTGCWSYVGMSGGQQVLSLSSPECVGSAVVSHQLMHALGFYHEQSRSDRDKYITILWANIWKEEVRNFDKFKTNNVDMPYDYGSIMHFGKYAYSEDGNPTILPKWNSGVKLGQSTGPSAMDILKINKLYSCN